MKWLREAISDDAGLADMAYLVIGMLALAAVLALAFIFTMSAIDYRSCMPTTTVATQTAKEKDEKSVHVAPCRFDPLPVGQSAGLIFGAFATLIAGLSSYMLATRRNARAKEAEPAPAAAAPAAPTKGKR